MKKYLVIILSFVAMHTHAMETENSTNAIVPTTLQQYPSELFDLIAQFLPFHDYETEEEFIERTQALTIKVLPKKCPIYISIKYSAYSPNNAIIAASEKSIGTFDSGYDIVQKLPSPKPQLCIIDRRTNKKQFHTTGNHHQKLAISNDGNMIATIYKNYDLDPLTGSLTAKAALSITNFSTDKKEFHNIPTSFKISDEHPTIAFNKQGTDIIVHAENYQHIIFPLTINTPNPNTDNKKTFAKYFAQQGICKDLKKQITAKK